MNYFQLFSTTVFVVIFLFVGISPIVFAETFHVSVPEGTSVRGCENTNQCYIPYEITIEKGDQIVWTNEDVAFHTVTSGKSTDGPDGVFDSGMFKIDEQFSHTFESSGKFDYFCTLHPWMEGIVLVKAASDQGEELNEGGGCLIATATFGSELSPQVQKLREIRDNSLMKTQLGSGFVEAFNGFYYSFSPTIADYERQNPLFKESVKIGITPMITSLTLLSFVEMNSELEVLGYGASLILLNIGMYLGIPAIVIIAIRKQK